MNRVICVNGHFFDGDKYESCPHCAEGAAPIEPERFSSVRGAEKEEKSLKKEKKGFFKKKEQKMEAPVPMVKENKTAMYTETQDEPENSLKEASAEKKSVSKKIDPTEKVVSSTHSEQRSSLSEAFKQVSEPPKMVKESPDEGKTIGFFSTGRSEEPPVGYLICVAGDDFGMGFPLKSGNNAIGRSQSMDVVIMDTKVSREKQAFVMYEPYKREFYIKPGEGNGLCYFNEEVVLAPMKIGAFDTIMLGDTKLMLVPVCCDRFSWDELRK